MTQQTLTLADGKYTLVYEDGMLSALRYGEPWRDLVGDKMVGEMFEEILRLRALAAVAYAAQHELTDKWLDVFLAAAEGMPFETEDLIGDA